jgi:putative transposase
MREWQSLAHVKWECKYHVVIVPKYWRKTLFGHVRKRVGKVFQQLCRQKDVGLVEGHVIPIMCNRVLSIPPK